MLETHTFVRYPYYDVTKKYKVLKEKKKPQKVNVCHSEVTKLYQLAYILLVNRMALYNIFKILIVRIQKFVEFGPY